MAGGKLDKESSDDEEEFAPPFQSYVRVLSRTYDMTYLMCVAPCVQLVPSYVRGSCPHQQVWRFGFHTFWKKSSRLSTARQTASGVFRKPKRSAVQMSQLPVRATQKPASKPVTMTTLSEDEDDMSQRTRSILRRGAGAGYAVSAGLG